MAQRSSATDNTIEWDTIDWRNSESKNIILNDLRTGVLPLDENEASAEEAWEHYRHLPAFQGEGVQFEQFKKRLADHREQIGGRIERAMFDGAAVAHDWMKHPYPTHNQHGKPNFHLSPAEELLRQDISNNRHVGLLPSQLQSTRDEYKVFKPRKFKELIYQTIRHIKFRNFIEERKDEMPFDYRPWP